MRPRCNSSLINYANASNFIGYHIERETKMIAIKPTNRNMRTPRMERGGGGRGIYEIKKRTRMHQQSKQ